MFEDCEIWQLWMQECTGVAYATSEQHIDLSVSRQDRDECDIQKLSLFLSDLNPFGNDDGSLGSIASGLKADELVNADKAKEVGLKILNDMTGKDATEYVFKRKSQIVTLASTSAFILHDESIIIDPAILFQRLIMLIRTTKVDLQSIFKYELCTHPAVLL